MKKINFISLLFLLQIILFSCNKEDSSTNFSECPMRLVIANEGQFMYGTASLTGVTFNGDVYQDIFRQTNNRTIGDVAQSIISIGENLYVTLNNSRKIEVFNKNSFHSVATIITPESTIPTYMCYLGGNLMAVAEKGVSGRLLIVDINTNEVSKVIPNVGEANQMLLIENK